MKASDQDIEALRYLFAVKVATYKQIHRDIYPDKTLKTVYNRIALLAKQKLVSGIYDRLGLPADKVLSLSKRGFNRFVAKGGEKRVELRSDSVLHDLTLCDLRSEILNWRSIEEYYTENTVQSWWPACGDTAWESIVKLQSDAVARMKFPKGSIWVAIEYESADKLDHRYERILRNYYRSLDVPLVLYICHSERVLNRLKELDRKVYTGEFPKFFYLLKHGLSVGDAATFTNRDGKTLRFESNLSRESLENSSGIFPAS